GRRRKGVDGVRADQLFDVKHVAILWILGAGAGPEETLRLRAFGGEGLPARAAEKFLILLVGDPGIGNGHLAAETFEQRLLAGIRSRLELFFDLAVNQGID